MTSLTTTASERKPAEIKQNKATYDGGMHAKGGIRCIDQRKFIQKRYTSNNITEARKRSTRTLWHGKPRVLRQNLVRLPQSDVSAAIDTHWKPTLIPSPNHRETVDHDCC